MNKAFPSPHPSLIAFVQIIEERARDRVGSLERKMRENNDIPPQKKVNIPEISASHCRFRPSFLFKINIYYFKICLFTF